MGAFQVIIQQLVSFLIMIVIGYAACRASVLTSNFLDGLSSLILKVLLPVNIFAYALNGTSRAELLSCWPIGHRALTSGSAG